MYNDLLLNRLAPVAEADGRIQELIDEIEELDNLLSPEAQQLIRDLRPHTVTDDVYEDIDEHETFGGRIADKMASFAGSWKFILSFMALMAVWVVLNGAMGERAFDPFPFILLNLALSTLAGLQAPVILMAQNRQSTKDRAVAENDYQVNLKNELEIADLHRKIDVLSDSLLNQTRMVNALVAARRQELSATVRAMENARGDLNNGIH
ncbi:MAG: DUF1003 domain-containing protein [Anaerolineae bacterium]|nr:DUF1003 domain-containing protein [Anaerolineae bacterium]